MAWMKSEKTGRWFLTGEFTSHRFDTEPLAAQVSDVLGFGSASAKSEAIQAELDRVAANRAALIADITAAVIAALPKAEVGTISSEEIAKAVNAELADDFDAMRADVNKPRTLS